MKFSLNRLTCNSGGCKITDTFTVRVTVNPDAKTSMFSMTSTYTPTSGNFTEEHLRMWSISTGGVINIQGNTKSLSTARGGNETIVYETLTNFPYLRRSEL